MLTQIKEQGDSQLMWEHLCMNENTNYTKVLRRAINIVLQLKKLINRYSIIITWDDSKRGIHTIICTNIVIVESSSIGSIWLNN